MVCTKNQELLAISPGFFFDLSLLNIIKEEEGEIEGDAGGGGCNKFLNNLTVL